MVRQRSLFDTLKCHYKHLILKWPHLWLMGVSLSWLLCPFDVTVVDFASFRARKYVIFRMRKIHLKFILIFITLIKDHRVFSLLAYYLFLFWIYWLLITSTLLFYLYKYCHYHQTLFKIKFKFLCVVYSTSAA